MIWDRPPVSPPIPIQPTMKLATSRFPDVSKWWVSVNRNARIGIAIAIPSLVLLLFTTPFTKKLAEAWKRATGKANLSQKKETPPRSKNVAPNTNERAPRPPPKKSYADATAASVKHETTTVAQRSPKKSSADAAANLESVEPVSPPMPGNASFSSEGSGEHTQKQKFKLGKNIRKRWQNSPFGHNSSEGVVSP